MSRRRPGRKALAAARVPELPERSAGALGGKPFAPQPPLRPPLRWVLGVFAILLGIAVLVIAASVWLLIHPSVVGH